MFGLSVDIDERWAELDYGEFDGVPVTQVPEAIWQQWRADVTFAPPGGESIVQKCLAKEANDRWQSAAHDRRRGEPRLADQGGGGLGARCRS
jgi:broad specificity phosphatase PhoE